MTLSTVQETLISAHLENKTLQPLLEESRVESGGSQSITQFYIDDGVLLRHWMFHPSKDEQEWSTFRQFVVRASSYSEP